MEGRRPLTMRDRIKRIRTLLDNELSTPEPVRHRGVTDRTCEDSAAPSFAQWFPGSWHSLPRGEITHEILTDFASINPPSNCIAYAA